MFSRLALIALVFTSAFAFAQEPRVNVGGPLDLNRMVLSAVNRMPSGGKYAVTPIAFQRLSESIRIDGSRFALTPQNAMPSYCAGATYHVLLDVINQLERRGSISPRPELLQALLVTGQRDGEGIWGRWNANGPGTAKLFTDARLGRNFTDWQQARAGDFLKVFWTHEIGQKERGHSVVYLGTETSGDGENVVFWSSNQPDGFGRKSVPLKKVAWAIFSRFESPENLQRLAELPRHDSFLADLLKRRSSRAEVAARCAMR
jgi:hypothetical protein